MLETQAGPLLWRSAFVSKSLPERIVYSGTSAAETGNSDGLLP